MERAQVGVKDVVTFKIPKFEFTPLLPIALNADIFVWVNRPNVNLHKVSECLSKCLDFDFSEVGRHVLELGDSN